MSRTRKDAPKVKKSRWYFRQNFKTLKTWTNRRMRRYKGIITSGGSYKKMFDDRWNYD